MMNLLALGLLAASLAVAGVFSPVPAPQHPNTNAHLIREGHRLIVVEYERHLDDSSPPPPTTRNQNHAYPDATSLLPNLGEGLSTPSATETSPQVPPFAEQAKDKAAQLEQSTKDAIKHVADKAKEKCDENKGWIGSMVERSKEKTEDAKNAAKDVIGKASEKAEHAKHAAKDAMEKASERAEDAKHAAKNAMEKASDKAEDAAKSVKEKLSKKADEAKSTTKKLINSAAKKEEELREKMPLKDAIGVTIEGGEDLLANVSSVTQEAAEKKAGEVAAELKKDATEIIRRMQSLVYTVVLYVTTPESAKAATEVVHLLGFVTAYGAGLWVTFMSSHVLARALPRQQFGVVQSKLYPVYFRVVAYGIVVAFLAHFFGRDLRPVAERVSGYNLLAVLGLVLVNMLFLEPKATKVMFERMKMEKEEGRGRDMADMVTEPPLTTAAAAATGTSAFGSSSFGIRRRESTMDQETVSSRMGKLNNRLKKLNTCSSLLNIVALMGLTWHLVHLACCLQACC